MNDYMKRFLIAALFLFVSFVSAAQSREVEVQGVTGEYIWMDNSEVTPKQARENALADAKSRAMNQAGVAERITEDFVVVSNDRGQSGAGYSGSSRTGGVVRISNMREETELRRGTGFNYLVVKVTADFTVRIYNEMPDPEFRIRVGGVAKSYSLDRGQALLTFNITSSRSGYLKIFAIPENNAGVMLYPNAYETRGMLNEGERVFFPTVKTLDYPLSIDDPGVSVETNRLIFVYTKDNVPYMDDVVDHQGVLCWIARLKPDRFTMVTETFMITRQGAR